ncbi:hypothetical protein MAIT1_00490 [Magnetofaba australis IT-1]|uniref:Uncharacterized protein n=1 Tax=Magnetofaba australis IT-1 TaxID=1434232 RepID=A0A1Y2JYV2_9PROT|nr:hypothetical protein MAIT1_00490 [Magnetofaba australis IT-1]
MIPVLILGALALWVDWGRMYSIARQADPAWLGVAFLINAVTILLQGVRWRMLLASDGGNWPWGRILRLHVKATFFDIFTPGRMGSDAVRLAAAAPEKRHHVAASLVAMRLQGLAAILLTLMAALLLTQSQKLASALGSWGAWALWLLAVAGLSGGVWFLLRMLRMAERWSEPEGWRGRIAEHGARFGDALRDVGRNRRVLLQSGLVALLFVVIACGVYWAAGRGFGVPLTWSDCLLGVPAIMIAIVLPITVHGRGFAELTALTLWSGPAAAPEAILLTCLGVYAIQLSQSALGGLGWTPGKSMSA